MTTFLRILVVVTLATIPIQIALNVAILRFLQRRDERHNEL